MAGRSEDAAGGRTEGRACGSGLVPNSWSTSRPWPVVLRRRFAPFDPWRRTPAAAQRSVVRVGSCPQESGRCRAAGHAGLGAADRSGTGHAVCQLAEDVEVPVVPGGLLDQVEQDPAQRHGPTTDGPLGRGVQVQAGDQVPVAGAPRLVFT
jgi:hypothetical protein